jgi:hypothetical protein
LEAIQAVAAMEAVAVMQAVAAREAVEAIQAVAAMEAVAVMQAVAAREAVEAIQAVAAMKAELGGLASDSNSQRPKAESGLPRRPVLQGPRAQGKRSMDADRHTDSSRHRSNCDSLRPKCVYCSCSNPNNPTLGRLETVRPALPCSSSKSVKAERSWEQGR